MLFLKQNYDTIEKKYQNKNFSLQFFLQYSKNQQIKTPKDLIDTWIFLNILRINKEQLQKNQIDIWIFFNILKINKSKLQKDLIDAWIFLYILKNIYPQYSKINKQKHQKNQEKTWILFNILKITFQSNLLIEAISITLLIFFQYSKNDFTSSLQIRKEYFISKQEKQKNLQKKQPKTEKKRGLSIMDSQKQELSAKKSDVIFLEDIIVTLKDNNNFLPIEIQKNLSSPLQKITQYVATQIQKHLLREIGQKNMSGHTLLDQVSSSLQTIRNNIQQTEQTKLDSKILIPVLVEMQSFINELKKKQQEPLSPGNIEQEINLLQMLTQKNIRSFQTTKMQCHLPELPVEYPKELQQIDLTIKELNLEKARLLQEKQILFSNKASASPFPIITPTKQFPGNGKIVGDNLTNNSKLIKGNIPQKTLQTQNLIEKVSILIYDPYTQIQEQNEFKTKVADQKCSIFSFLNEKKQDQVEFLSPGFCSKPKKLKIVDVLMKTYITLKNFFQSCKTPFQIIVLSSQIEEQPQEIVQQDVFKFTTNIKKLKAQVNIHIVQNNQQIFVQNIIKDINDMNQSDIKAKYTFSKGQIFNLIDNQQQNVQQSSNQQNEILAQQIQAHKQRALQSVESIQQQNKQEFQQSKADLKNFISQQEAEKTRQIKIMNNNKEIEQIDNKLEMEQQKRTTLLCEIELQNKKIQREQNDQETANQEVQRRLSIISQTVKSINLNEEFIVLDQCKQMANDLQILLDYLLNVQASLFLKESDILFIKYAFISNITPLNLNKGNIFDLVCEYIFKQSEPLEFRQQLSQIPLAFYLSRNTREQTLKMFQDNLNLINFLNKIVEAFDSCNLLAICSNMIMNSQKEHSNLLSMVHEAQELQFSFSKKWLFNRSTFF